MFVNLERAEVAREGAVLGATKWQGKERVEVVNEDARGGP